jgi:hypothetical protein
VDYNGSKQQSIPAGNLLFEETDNFGDHNRATITIKNGLRNSMNGMLQFYLPWCAAGYRSQGGRIIQTVRSGDKAIVTVSTNTPAGTNMHTPSTRQVEVRTVRNVRKKSPGCASASITAIGNNGDPGGPGPFLGFLLTMFLLPLLYCIHGRHQSTTPVAMG